MTTFTTPFKFKLPFVETTVAVIDTSGTATFADIPAGTISGTAAISLNGVTIVNADTTVVAQGTAAVIPASAEGFFTVNIGGTDFLVPYFTKA